MMFLFCSKRKSPPEEDRNDFNRVANNARRQSKTLAIFAAADSNNAARITT
jgi:hypothetical protein